MIDPGRHRVTAKGLLDRAENTSTKGRLRSDPRLLTWHYLASIAHGILACASALDAIHEELLAPRASLGKVPRRHAVMTSDEERACTCAPGTCTGGVSIGGRRRERYATTHAACLKATRTGSRD